MQERGYNTENKRDLHTFRRFRSLNRVIYYTRHASFLYQYLWATTQQGLALTY